MRMNTSTEKNTLNQYGIKRIRQVFSTILLYAVILFIAAGRMDWWMAWLYLGLYLVLTVINAALFWRKDVDLINERGRNAENQKPWDKVLMTLYLALCIALFLVAGLDAGRYGWWPVTGVWMWLGVAGVVLAYILISRTMMANTYLSTVARIQEERGQRVVSGRPLPLRASPDVHQPDSNVALHGPDAWFWLGAAAGCIDRGAFCGAYGVGRRYAATGITGLYRLHPADSL